jgi:TPR repeat protein
MKKWCHDVKHYYNLAMQVLYKRWDNKTWSCVPKDLDAAIHDLNHAAELGNQNWICHWVRQLMQNFTLSPLRST